MRERNAEVIDWIRLSLASLKVCSRYEKGGGNAQMVGIDSELPVVSQPDPDLAGVYCEQARACG
jgi:hypothetical protein